MPAQPLRIFGRDWLWGTGDRKAALEEAAKARAAGSPHAFVACMQAGECQDVDGVLTWVNAGPGYWSSVFTDKKDFRAFLNSRERRKVCGSANVYELMCQGPMRVGFDLEFDPGGEEPKPQQLKHQQCAVRLCGSVEAAKDKETFLRAVLVQRLLPWLSHLAGAPVTLRDLSVTDASNDAKLSFHVLVNALALPNAASICAFGKRVQADFGGKAPADSLWLGPLAPLLDCGVYGPKLMRMVMCAKNEDARARARLLRPVSSVGTLVFSDAPTLPEDGTFTAELLRQYMWTHVPEGCAMLELGCGEPTPDAPRVAKRPRGAFEGVTDAEALKRFKPYLSAAGLRAVASLRLTSDDDGLRFYTLTSSDTCPLCEEDSHPNRGYWLRCRDSAPGVSALTLGAHSTACAATKHLGYAVTAPPSAPDDPPSSELTAAPPARFECYRVWVERHLGAPVRLLDTPRPFGPYVRVFCVECGGAPRRVGVTAGCAVRVEGAKGGAGWELVDVFLSPYSDMVVANPAMHAWWRAEWGRVCDALGGVEDAEGRVTVEQLGPAPVYPWYVLKELHALAKRNELLVISRAP